MAITIGRLGNTCVLVAIVIFLLVSFAAFLRTPGPSVPIYRDPNSPRPPPKPVKQPKFGSGGVKQKFPSGFKSFEVPKDIAYEPDGPLAHQIVIVSASDGGGHNGGIPNLIPRTNQNRLEYAELHGYIYQFINITKYDLQGAKPVWAKLPAIADTFNQFPEAQWIWWLDSDAIIMSPEVELTTNFLSPAAISRHLLKNTRLNFMGNKINQPYFTVANPDPTQIDLLIAQDDNGLNAGSFFIRRSLTTKILMDVWADPVFVYAGWGGEEQEVLQHLVQGHPTLKERVGLMRMKLFNAYPRAPDFMLWSKGDLAVHLAGCWVKDLCAEQFEEHWNKRETVAQYKERVGKEALSGITDEDRQRAREKYDEEWRKKEVEFFREREKNQNHR